MPLPETLRFSDPMQHRGLRCIHLWASTSILPLLNNALLPLAGSTQQLTTTCHARSGYKALYSKHSQRKASRDGMKYKNVRYGI
jgi:hypothetical protein